MKANSRPALLLVAPALALGLVTGCSSSKPQVCTDVKNLQKSVQSLRDVSVGSNALTTLKNDLSQIRQQLVVVKNSAKQQFSPEIDKLSAAVDKASAAFDAVATSPSASNIAALTSSVAGVVDASKGLASAVSGTC